MTKYSDKLTARYAEELRAAFDWKALEQEIRDNPQRDDCGDIVGLALLGSVLTLLPSGKIYTCWTTNQTARDTIRDQAFMTALESIAEEHGMFITEFSGDLFAGVMLDSGDEALVWCDRDRGSPSGWYEGRDCVARNCVELERHMEQSGVYPGLYVSSPHGDLHNATEDDIHDRDGYDQDGDTPELDEFTRAYIECMLWADLRDDEGGPINGMDEDDLTEQALMACYRDCRDFQFDNRETLADAYANGATPTQAGHDFWLTRQGHGAGFWDRPDVYGKDHARVLSDAARIYSTIDPYLTDDDEVDIL